MENNKMRLGVMASSFQTKEYGRWGENTYKKLKEHGFSCTDFNMAETDSIIYTESEKVVKKLLIKEKKLAEESGIEITQVHGPWRWPAQDTTSEDRAERMEKMKKSIMFTAVLGCKNWVIHPIMPFGVQEIGTEEAKKTREMNLKFFREILITAKEYGITICFENMPMIKFSLATPKDIMEFVDEINDENFKICLDTGHVSVFEDLNLADEVRRLGDRIKVLHVHDNRFGMDLHLMPHYGVINWEEFVKALKDINFTGSFSLETVPPASLNTELFEMGCKLLAGISKELIDKF